MLLLSKDLKLNHNDYTYTCIPVAFCPNNYSLQTAKCTPTVLCSCPLTVFVYRSGQRSILIKHQNENTSVIFELEV